MYLSCSVGHGSKSRRGLGALHSFVEKKEIVPAIHETELVLDRIAAVVYRPKPSTNDEESWRCSKTSAAARSLPWRANQCKPSASINSRNLSKRDSPSFNLSKARICLENRMNHSTSTYFVRKVWLVLWFILLSKHIQTSDRLKLGESLLNKFLEFIDADGF